MQVYVNSIKGKNALCHLDRSAVNVARGDSHIPDRDNSNNNNQLNQKGTLRYTKKTYLSSAFLKDILTQIHFIYKSYCNIEDLTALKSRLTHFIKINESCIFVVNNK